MAFSLYDMRGLTDIYMKNGWRSSEAIQAIEHSIQKQAEAVVDMCMVGCIQRGTYWFAIILTKDYD